MRAETGMKTWTTVSTAWKSFVKKIDPTAPPEPEASTAKAVWTAPTVTFRSRTGAAALAW